MTEENKCIVRLTTDYWHDLKGAYIKKSLRYLKRQCEGHNVLYEDCQVMGSFEAISSITNLYECKDGVYQVVACNVSKDWETGIIDDWDLKLVAYKEK